MRCPNCNSLIADDINFCNYCGENLHKENTTNNTVVNNTQTTTTLNVKEEYLSAYIGKNYDTIKQKGFNVFAFFLTHYYLLYRKQSKYFWMLVGISFFTLFFGGIGSIVSFIIPIFAGIKFNEMYIQEAEKDIQQIVNTNKGKTDEEIIELCKQKGGTSTVGPAILFTIQAIFTITLIIAFIMLMAVSTNTETDSYKPNNDYNSNYEYEYNNEYEYYDNEI